MNPVAKLAIAGINMGAAALVGKGLGAAWTKATGNQPPAISHESEAVSYTHLTLPTTPYV